MPMTLTGSRPYFGATLRVNQGSTNDNLIYFDPKVLEGLAEIASNKDSLQQAVAEIDEGGKDTLDIQVYANQRDIVVQIQSQHNGTKYVKEEPDEGIVARLKRAIERAKEWAPNLKTRVEAEAPELTAAQLLLTKVSGALLANRFEIVHKYRGSVILKIGDEFFRIRKEIRPDENDEAKDFVRYDIEKIESPNSEQYSSLESIGISRQGTHGELNIYHYSSRDIPSDRCFAHYDNIMKRKARSDASKRMVLMQNQLAAEIIKLLEASGALQNPRLYA